MTSACYLIINMTNKQILRRLRIEYLVFVLLAVLLVVLHETQVLAEGVLVGKATAVYVAECAGILLTIALIPLALKSYHKALLRMADMDDDAARRRSYVKWNEIRLAMFVVIVLLNTSIYYATLDNMCGYCAIMGMIASFFCWPTKDGVDVELAMCPEPITEGTTAAADASSEETPAAAVADDNTDTPVQD